jgi:hypothetical protein
MAERPTVPANAQLYSIVVAGSMNPRIHHPSWYRMVGIITEQEADAATKDDGTFCAPAGARFSVQENFEIICQLDRWSVLTDREDQTERILEIASKTFKILAHTPVHAVGINSNFIRQTSVSDVGLMLGKAVGSLGFDLHGEGQESAEVTMRWTVKGRQLNVAVAPIAGIPSHVEVRVNAHYHEFGELLGEHFDLDVVFRQHFEDDIQTARQLTEKILAALRQWRQNAR